MNQLHINWVHFGSSGHKEQPDNVVDNFIKIMSSNMNNNNLMMDSFRRQNYMQTFIAYINNNSFKYDA